MRSGMSGDVNSAMADASEMIKRVQTNEIVTQATEESYAAVDIAGYNYAVNRYVMDKELFPNRVICGSETFPKDIANNWKLVKENSHVIGDFTWTGWDYLGEAGIGKVSYGENEGWAGVSGAYPWLLAYCFTASEHTTFHGRALAVIRPTGIVSIRVTVEAEGCTAETVEIEAC
jgi:beta-galactosidase